MKATGIVRRIDDLGRVVIPKEIRRTMRIREGDPLEIYTTRDGEVIFKKYSLIGGLEEFAAQFCDTLSRSTDFSAAVTDRDAVIAMAGAGKKELLGKSLSPELERIMAERGLYCGEGVAVSEEDNGYRAAVAAPILCEGDVLGAVLFLSPDGRTAGVSGKEYGELIKRPCGEATGSFCIYLSQDCQSFTCRRSQSHQASMPSPVLAETGNISSLGLRRWAYSTTLSMSKSK